MGASGYEWQDVCSFNIYLLRILETFTSRIPLSKRGGGGGGGEDNKNMHIYLQI